MSSISHSAHAFSVEAIYRQEHGWLKAWLQRKLGTSSHAADLAHDTFVRLLTPPEVEPIREPRAYLRTVARGLLINHWRHQDLERAWIETLAHFPTALAPSPEERAMALQTLQLIDTMLRRLNPKARSAFLLSQLDGLTYLQIAEQLKVSERMVKRYMSQAMFECLLLEQE